ncbi:hypothetical protein ACQ4PT_039955 [Festuca glaucescens]
MSPSADSARRREIWLGKRPVEESEVVPPAMDPTVSNIPFLSASSAPSFVYPGDQYNSVRSSSAPETLRGPFLQGSSSHIRTEYDSPFYMDALACAYESDSSENAFPNESVPPTTAGISSSFYMDALAAACEPGFSDDDDMAGFSVQDLLSLPQLADTSVGRPIYSIPRSSHVAPPAVSAFFQHIHRTPTVAATPFVPTEKAIENQRKRKLLIKETHASKRGRLSIGVSLLPADVSLPLPANYIAALKSAWPGRSFYGAPHYVCIHCGASFWYQERCKHDSTEKSVVYKGCCRGGKISLPVYPDWPHPLKELIRFDGDAVSDHFMHLIREYNAMFAFTSIGVHVDDTVNVGNGPYVFKICGVVAHKIGSLLPSADRPTPKFAQMYIYDTENELDHRMNIFDTVNNEKDDDDATPADGPSASVRRLSRRKERPDPNIVRSLTTMLNEYWVLAVGDGTVPMTTREGEASPSWICIPNDVALLSDADPKGTIIDAIYESFAQNYNDPAYLGSRAIVCPTNSNTDDINDILLSKVPGDVTHFDSCDTICQSMDHVADADLLYSPEFLHGIELSNFPHHRISLKIGVPIMLLRNINQSIGLCNGTRLMVTRLGEWVLEAEIMTGIGKGERAMEKEKAQTSTVSDITAKSYQCRLLARIYRIWELKDFETRQKTVGFGLTFVDQQGNTIEGFLPADRISQFRHRLKEGSVYTIESFMIIEPRKSYKTSSHPHRIRLAKHRSINEMNPEPKNFPRIAYNAMLFDQLSIRKNNNEYLSDVVGVITALTDLIPSKTNSDPRRKIYLTDARYKLTVNAKDLEPDEDSEEVLGQFGFLGEHGAALTGYSVEMLIAESRARPGELPLAIRNVVGKKCIVVATVTQHAMDADNITFRVNHTEFISTATPHTEATNTPNIPASTELLQAVDLGQSSQNTPDGTSNMVKTPAKDVLEPTKQYSEEVFH